MSRFVNFGLVALLGILVLSVPSFVGAQSNDGRPPFPINIGVASGADEPGSFAHASAKSAIWITVWDKDVRKACSRTNYQRELSPNREVDAASIPGVTKPYTKVFVTLCTGPALPAKSYHAVFPT